MPNFVFAIPPFRGDIQKTPESAYYERLKLTSGIPLLWDDPRIENKEMLDRIIQTTYLGNTRTVRGNRHKPRSSAMLTCNFSLGDTNDAIQTRSVGNHFKKVKDIDTSKRLALNKACDEVSSNLSALIALGYPKANVDALESELSSYMPLVNARVPKSLSLFVHYAREFASLVGEDVEAFMEWIYKVYCPPEANRQEDLSNLENFLTKIVQLIANNEIGGWNVKPHTDPTSGKKYLAVWLPDVFKAVTKHFPETIYSEKILRPLIGLEGGSAVPKSIRFHCDKQASQDYQRANAYTDTNSRHRHDKHRPPNTIPQAAYLIPIELAEKCGYSEASSEPKDDPEVSNHVRVNLEKQFENTTEH